MRAPASAEDVVRWAETRSTAGAASPLEQYQILLASKLPGMTPARLAADFGRPEGEIARVLAAWTDTTQAAKTLLRARTLELADRMLSDADPGIALEILERLQVVDASTKGAHAGLTIQIGGDGNDIKIGLLNGQAATAD